MNGRLLPMRFSVIAVAMPLRDAFGPSGNVDAVLTLTLSRTDQSYFFTDLESGVLLWLSTNNTFQLADPSGYNSGAVRAQQMQFEGNEISVWHQDERLSFSCHANTSTGFCFGWLIDRTCSRSCRILDPGRTR